MSLKKNSFSCESRLADKDSFSRVFAAPVFTQKNQFFSVFAAKASQRQARLGIVVAKRKVRLAVERNRLKRFIRESFRHQGDQLGSFDVVVVVNKNFVSLVESKKQLPELFVGLRSRAE